MIRKKIVWFGIKLYGLVGKLYGLERNCMVSNHESYGLGRVWGRQVCIWDEKVMSMLRYCWDFLVHFDFRNLFFKNLTR